MVDDELRGFSTGPQVVRGSPRGGARRGCGGGAAQRLLRRAGFLRLVRGIMVKTIQTVNLQYIDRMTSFRIFKLSYS